MTWLRWSLCQGCYSLPINILLIPQTLLKCQLFYKARFLEPVVRMNHSLVWATRTSYLYFSPVLLHLWPRSGTRTCYWSAYDISFILQLAVYTSVSSTGLGATWEEGPHFIDLCIHLPPHSPLGAHHNASRGEGTWHMFPPVYFKLRKQGNLWASNSRTVWPLHRFDSDQSNPAACGWVSACWKTKTVVRAKRQLIFLVERKVAALWGGLRLLSDRKYLPFWPP